MEGGWVKGEPTAAGSGLGLNPEQGSRASRRARR